MAQYDNTNKGALWKVADRKTDNHPHFTGQVNVDGKEFWVSAWATREPEGNKPHIRLALTAKEEARGAEPAEDPVDDDIPF